MKYLPLITGLLAIQWNAAAQTLTNQDICPAPGDSFRQYYGPFIDPGTDAIGATWNLGSMTSSSNWISAYTANTNTNFPNANLELDETYYQANAEKLEMIAGEYADINWLETFSDPMLLMSFPVTSEYDTTDTYESTITYSGVTYQRIGNSHYQFSGYGTLITPIGTFTDVVRIKIIRHEDETGSDGSVRIIDSERYSWYKAGTHHPLAEVVTTYVNQGCETFGYYYENLETAAVNELSIQLEIAPNPVADYLHFNSEIPIKSVDLLDQKGSIVFRKSLLALENTIDLSSIDKGSFIAVFHTIDGKPIIRHIVVI